MSEDDQSEKQFEASQKKLDDARAKGEIVKSVDLTTAGSYLGLIVTMAFFGSASMIAVAGSLKTLLDQAGALSTVFFEGPPNPMMGGVFLAVGKELSLWFFLPASVALLSLLGQRAIVFAPTKITPKLSRISPISGVKNKFGRQGLFEFFKSFSKLVIYCIVLGVFLFHQMDRITGTMHMSAGMVAVTFGQLTLAIMIIVLVVTLILGIGDFAWQFSEHHRKNRMTRKEMTDELKQSEGDPVLKQQRRQKGVEIAMNQMLRDVSDADVVIVNPTHFAVALKWNRFSLGAPVCVAKGVDEIAARIREAASASAVPMHSDPPTARSLYATVKIGDEIRQSDFAAVATAIRFAESIKRKAVKR